MGKKATSTINAITKIKKLPSEMEKATLITTFAISTLTIVHLQRFDKRWKNSTTVFKNTFRKLNR